MGKNLCRAFISVIRYPDSAWIGNLIVDPLCRGCGYGSLLFNAEVKALNTQRLKRIWLTASAMGMPLYQKHGFSWIDDCERWIGSGVGQRGSTELSAQINEFIQHDTLAWGESRSSLLEYLGSFSPAVISAGLATLLQPGIHSWHVGPWVGRGDHTNSPADIEDFIARIRKATPGGQALSIDLLKASKLGAYLKQAGFRKIGSSALMCRTPSSIDIRRVYALASLGSIG